MNFASPLAAPAELSARQVMMLFPTPMFTGKLYDLGLCDRLEQAIRQLRASGIGISSPKNQSYMTPDDLQGRPEFKELVDVAMAESAKVLDAFAVVRDSHYVNSMWGNIANPNHRQNMHVHPNCLLSGLIYIKAPVNCGPTMFVSPRRLTKNFEPRYQVRNDINSDYFIMPAEKGRMLLWPSHIPHAVEQGTADESEERIVIAFNVSIRGRIDLATARMELV
jgi:uncharacterized protein (TIGR02466 family)